MLASPERTLPQRRSPPPLKRSEPVARRRVEAKPSAARKLAMTHPEHPRLALSHPFVSFPIYELPNAIRWATDLWYVVHDFPEFVSPGKLLATSGMLESMMLMYHFAAYGLDLDSSVR